MATITNPAPREGRLYYVTVRDAGRHGYLLGPYDTHEEALENVDRGRKLAEEANVWSHFYEFGTGSLPASLLALPKSLFGL